MSFPDVLGCPRCDRSISRATKRCPGCGAVIRVLQPSDDDGKSRVIADDSDEEIDLVEHTLRKQLQEDGDSNKGTR